MTKTILLAAIVLFFTSCQNTAKTETTNSTSETTTTAKLTEVNYTVAKNYFVNNTVKKLDNPKIETKEKFSEIFGMATTMAKDGKPTEIDFTKQNVFALVMPETDLMTTVKPVNLQKNEKGELTLNYKTVVGAKQTSTMIPSFAIIVDKAENGNLTLKEIK